MTALNAHQLLDQLAHQVREAQDALADENEGRLSRAVLLIESDASQLAELVRTW